MQINVTVTRTGIVTKNRSRVIVGGDIMAMSCAASLILREGYGFFNIGRSFSEDERLCPVVNSSK